MDTTGTAIRAYLQALRDSEAGPVARGAAPDRCNRYFGGTRLTPPPGPAGALLRDLLGLVRADWVHPADERGRPVGEAPWLMVGRPAPSGGGLYPIEAYLAAGGPDLPAGLFRYDPVHHVLETLRSGDHRPALTALLSAPPPQPPDLVLVLSAVFWRNGVKYGDFAYRLQCQEIGVLAAQAMAVAERLDLSASLHLRFDDPAADRLLGLDSAAESVLALLTVRQHATEPPSGNPAPRQSVAPPPPDGLAVRRHASTSSPDSLVITPAVRSTESQPVTGLLPHLAALHAATRAAAPAPEARPESPEPAPAATPTPTPAPMPTPTPTSAPMPKPTPTSALMPTVSQVFSLPAAAAPRLADGIPRRASPRTGYRPEAINLRELAQILAVTSTDCPGDLGDHPMVTLHLIALRVAGLPAGAYRYDAGRRELARVAGEPVPLGPLAPNTRVALRSAAAALVPVGDPMAGVRWFGDRWYRIQQAGTGLAVHRATLAAAALGISARIHSDGTIAATSAALGLTGSDRQALSFLLLGRPPMGPSLIRPLPAAAVDGAGSGGGIAPARRVGADRSPTDGRHHVRKAQPRP
ncbi:SagB family peptide dehydrogenase [Nonomuraea sp. NPDC026600]|uniref:SagB family peptide dehydrogenase n=1 Tax=Nonomuraea sp. NPDC026600 TaxID=3155363 RepID=UPI0033E1DD14